MRKYRPGGHKGSIRRWLSLDTLVAASSAANHFVVGIRPALPWCKLGVAGSHAIAILVKLGRAEGAPGMPRRTPPRKCSPCAAFAVYALARFVVCNCNSPPLLDAASSTRTVLSKKIQIKPFSRRPLKGSRKEKQPRRGARRTLNGALGRVGGLPAFNNQGSTHTVDAPLFAWTLKVCFAFAALAFQRRSVSKKGRPKQPALRPVAHRPRPSGASPPQQQPETYSRQPPTRSNPLLLIARGREIQMNTLREIP